MSAGSQGGKGLDLDTEIPTAYGFKRMEEIEVGDTVFDKDGKQCLVTFVSDVHYRDCYRVTFDDGSSVVADDEHLWLVKDFRARKNLGRGSKNKDIISESVVNTLELKDKLVDTHGGHNFSVDIAGMAEYEEKYLPIPPYTLGAWLGDGFSGSSAICCSDQDYGIIEKIKSEWKYVEPRKVSDGRVPVYSLSKGKGNNSEFGGYLKELGVLNNKHIPECYLTASVEQREELLRGLMDTDGYCDQRGHLEFTSSNENLAHGVLELVRSLGVKARMSVGNASINGRVVGKKYRVRFNAERKFFGLKRKQERVKSVVKNNTKLLYVVSVEKVQSVPTKCIQVDSKSRTYLATRSYVVTHNTSFGPHWLYREIESHGGGDYLAVTASFDLFKLKMLPSMLQVFEQIYKVGRYWAGDKIIEIKDPSTGKFWAQRSVDPMYARIILRSADALGGLESSTAKAAWLDECGQDRFVFEAYKAIRRRLALKRGRILMTTTLYNLGWLTNNIIDPAVATGTSVLHEGELGEIEVTVSETKGITVVQFDSVVNPSFPKEEFEEARELLPEDEFNMFYRGRKSSLRFLIYDCFLYDKHTVPRFEIPDSWPRYVGLDFGGAHTCAMFYAEEPGTGKLYAYREYLAGGRTIEDHAKEIMRGEPTVPVVYGGARSEDQWRMEFAKWGLPVYEYNLVDVNLGINRVYAQHKSDGIIYFRDLKGILDEKGRYRRKRDREGNAIDEIEGKGTYHYLDAERYIIAQIRPGKALGAKVVYLGASE